ncbi:hypothetical protein ACJIZ3_025220 [Penstemon smallii]|uniref:Uncharacterized protein n=1 Tax=Penstemon smallii TaxID=265156 RepID=A0ABD3TTZ8_9LAMI
MKRKYASQNPLEKQKSKITRNNQQTINEQNQKYILQNYSENHSRFVS